jgi:hypothetical protein
VASRLTLDAFCARRRLVSLDGMVFDLPDTEENTQGNVKVGLCWWRRR